MYCLRALMILVLLAAGPVRAVVVDNFEEGPFSLSGDIAGGFGLQSPLAVQNAIDDERDSSIQSGAPGQLATAELALTAGDDAVVATLPASGGTLSFIYRPAPTDLTAGGSSDRLVFETLDAPSGAGIVLTLEDTVGGSTTIGPPFSGPGSFSILYSDLAGLVDLTQVVFVRLRFTGSGAGSWQIRDVRTGGPIPPVPALSGPAAVAVSALLTTAALLLHRRRLRVAR